MSQSLASASCGDERTYLGIDHEIELGYWRRRSCTTSKDSIEDQSTNDYPTKLDSDKLASMTSYRYVFSKAKATGELAKLAMVSR